MLFIDGTHEIVLEIRAGWIRQMSADGILSTMYHEMSRNVLVFLIKPGTETDVSDTTRLL